MQSTGTSVTAMKAAPNMANVLVKARGWKSFPSCPVKAKTGTKASTMIAIEAKIGSPTVFVASSTARHTRALSFVSMPSFSIARYAFSVTTMPASTKSEMAMAMPASDMMFDVMPKYFMKRNEKSTASGSGTVTMKTERKCARKRRLASVTRINSSTSAHFRVSVARLMSCVRS